jgi:hypothetical protein
MPGQLVASGDRFSYPSLEDLSGQQYSSLQFEAKSWQQPNAAYVVSRHMDLTKLIRNGKINDDI